MNREQFEQMGQQIIEVLADHDRALNMVNGTLDPGGLTNNYRSCAVELKRLLDSAWLDAWDWNELAYKYLDAYWVVELNPTFIETWSDVQ